MKSLNEVKERYKFWRVRTCVTRQLQLETSESHRYRRCWKLKRSGSTLASLSKASLSRQLRLSPTLMGPARRQPRSLPSQPVTATIIDAYRTKGCNHRSPGPRPKLLTIGLFRLPSTPPVPRIRSQRRSYRPRLSLLSTPIMRWR